MRAAAPPFLQCCPVLPARRADRPPPRLFPPVTRSLTTSQAKVALAAVADAEAAKSIQASTIAKVLFA